MRSADNLTKRGDMADCRIRIQRNDPERAGLDMEDAWKDVGATDDRPVRWRHAHFSQPTGARYTTEKTQADAVTAQDYITLRLDWIRGVDATCRVLFFRRENEPYEIIAEPENLRNQNRTMILRVRRARLG